ncbi:MAG TPA: hypothetical protein VGN81_33120 [Pseudonocardiaceae bacterium]
MKRKSYVNVMVTLCIVYGAVIGILAMTHLSNLGLIATIGAIVLGLGWSGVGRFSKS